MALEEIPLADAKKRLTQLVREKQAFIITRRGKPAAVVLPYDAYIEVRRAEALKLILEIRSRVTPGIAAETAYETARRELEGRGSAGGC